MANLFKNIFSKLADSYTRSNETTFGQPGTRKSYANLFGTLAPAYRRLVRGGVQQAQPPTPSALPSPQKRAASPLSALSPTTTQQSGTLAQLAARPAKQPKAQKVDQTSATPHMVIESPDGTRITLGTPVAQGTQPATAPVAKPAMRKLIEGVTAGATQQQPNAVFENLTGDDAAQLQSMYDDWVNNRNNVQAEFEDFQDYIFSTNPRLGSKLYPYSSKRYPPTGQTGTPSTTPTTPSAPTGTAVPTPTETTPAAPAVGGWNPSDATQLRFAYNEWVKQRRPTNFYDWLTQTNPDLADKVSEVSKLNGIDLNQFILQYLPQHLSSEDLLALSSLTTPTALPSRAIRWQEIIGLLPDAVFENLTSDDVAQLQSMYDDWVNNRNNVQADFEDFQDYIFSTNPRLGSKLYPYSSKRYPPTGQTGTPSTTPTTPSAPTGTAVPTPTETTPAAPAERTDFLNTDWNNIADVLRGRIAAIRQEAQVALRRAQDQIAQALDARRRQILSTGGRGYRGAQSAKVRQANLEADRALYNVMNNVAQNEMNKISEALFQNASLALQNKRLNVDAMNSTLQTLAETMDPDAYATLIGGFMGPILRTAGFDVSDVDVQRMMAMGITIPYWVDAQFARVTDPSKDLQSIPDKIKQMARAVYDWWSSDDDKAIDQWFRVHPVEEMHNEWEQEQRLSGTKGKEVSNERKQEQGSSGTGDEREIRREAERTRRAEARAPRH